MGKICFYIKIASSDNECNRKKRLKLLRLSFLLNSEDKEIIKQLIESLKESSYPYDSIFYETLLKGDDGKWLMEIFNKDTSLAGSALRRAIYKNDANLEQMKSNTTLMRMLKFFDN